MLDTIIKVLEREPDHPRTLRSDADRDLSIIALKCLQKDPAKRYGSAEALADDLDRWLRGEPIQARPVGNMERAVKWVKRNPLAAGLATAVALTLAVGTIVSLWFAIESGKNADAAAIKAREAEWFAIESGKNAHTAAIKAEEAEKNERVALARKTETEEARDWSDRLRLGFQSEIIRKRNPGVGHAAGH